MKQTAKELFKNLGWEYKDYENKIYYERTHNSGCIERITFIPSLKQFSTHTYHIDGVMLSLEELQAINKQVEELGWGEKENE